MHLDTFFLFRYFSKDKTHPKSRCLDAFTFFAFKRILLLCIATHLFSVFDLEISFFYKRIEKLTSRCVFSEKDAYF